MTPATSQNPVFQLYTKNKNKILLSRSTLFSKLNGINPEIRNQVEHLYYQRKESHPLPYMGELYPWVISDLYDIKDDKLIQDVSQNWLSFYYYTIFVDDVIDLKDNVFQGKELISLTALMKEGMEVLH